VPRGKIGKISEWGLYFITDRGLSKQGIFKDTEDALKAGVKVVQYREKEFSHEKMVEEAQKLKALCENFDADFIVNDHVGVAMAVDADGVHVGRGDEAVESARKKLGIERIVGGSARTLEQALGVQNAGADYVGFYPIFETATKIDAGSAVGVAALAEVVNALEIPVVAVGGITLGNLDSVLGARPASVVAISAVVGKPDVYAEALKIGNKIVSARKMLHDLHK